MNQRFVTIGGVLILFGAMLPATAGEHRRSASDAPASSSQPASQFRTTGYKEVRQYAGELTLEKAVELALRQNPAIITALQQIQITRGEIIEVRAVALPQITLTGSYEQQDPRLLKGGGESGSTSPSDALSGAAVPNPQAPTPVSSPSASAATQPTTPIGTIGSGTAPAAGGTGVTTTGGTVAPAAVAAGGGRLRERAIVATPEGQTVTSSGGSSTASSSSTGDPVNAQTLLNQLGAAEQSLNTPIQDKSWDVTVEVRQLLYAGGEVAAALKIAQFTQDSAYYQLRDTVDTIISTVRTQFDDVLLNRALITVQEESVRLLEQQLQDQRNRFEAGTVPRFNVLQAEVALANQRPSLISARNNYLVSQAQLAKTLGLDPGSAGKPAFFCVGELGVPPQRLTLPEALEIARARRPFLKVQRQTILIDVEDIKVQLAGYKPQLNAHAGYELRNRSTSEDISDTVNGWFFGVTGSWAIFDGFSTYGKVKQARGRLEQAKANYEDSVHEVDLEVQTSYSNLQQAKETISSQQENVTEALEAVRLAEERLNAGAGTQLDVLNAQVQLTSARTTELQARGNYNIALAQFELATATDTVYAEKFRDPLAKVQKGIFGRLAEIGLPKLPQDDRFKQDAKSR